MSTGLAAFDSTLQITSGWLAEIMNRLGQGDRQAAYHALRAVLHVLRDRLSVDEASALGAQLPMLVRGIYYEGWHAAGKPNKERTKVAFLGHVAKFYTQSPEIDVEKVVRAVLHVLARHISPGETSSLERALPAELRALFTTGSGPINELDRSATLPPSRTDEQSTTAPRRAHLGEKPAIAPGDSGVFVEDREWMDSDLV